MFKKTMHFGPDDDLIVNESQVITGESAVDNFWKDAAVISIYPWQQGVEDGILMRIEDFMEGFRPGWADSPCLMTTNLFAVIERHAQNTSDDDKKIAKEITRSINSIWNEFVGWRDYVYDTMDEEDRMFVTKRNGVTMWVIEDGVVITMLLPEDY